LTDGVTVEDWDTPEGYFYALPSSMGWTDIEPVIRFDLGEIRPIGGIGFHTALSRWGPYWPEETAVLVSDDGVNYSLAGVLKPEPEDFDPPLTQQQVQNALNRVPEGGSLHWYRSCPFETRGRYVGLIMSKALEGGSGAGVRARLTSMKSKFIQVRKAG
jgi:hypothetical protein